MLMLYAPQLVESPRFPEHLRKDHLELDGLGQIFLQRSRSYKGDIGFSVGYETKVGANVAKVSWRFEQDYEPPPAPPISNDVDELYELAGYWLETCHANHVGCRDPPRITPRESRLPARPIDVGKRDDPEFLPKICLTEGRPEDSMPYLALSHCWGNLQKFCELTKTTNIEKRLQYLPLNELSQNFRDAVIITQKLGHRYLWIDALCILQDDMRDWEKECVVMAAVFARAVCTIAAASAPDGSVGLFKRENVDEVKLFKFTFSEDDQRQIVILPEDLTGYQRFKEPSRVLDQRSWCLQEDWLSPRTLYYSDRGIYWNCNYGITYETDARPNKGFEGSQRMSYQGDENYSLQWRNCVEDFSRRKLTHRTDQLPALSGLAQVVVLQEDRNPHDTYLAGIWKDDLLNGLLWKKDSQDSTPMERPDTIINAECTPATIDPLGQASQGYLRLEGMVKKVHTTTSPANLTTNPPLSMLRLGNPHTMQERLASHRNMGPVFPILQQEQQVGQFYYDDPKDHMKTKELYCLRMSNIDIEADDLQWGIASHTELFPDEIPTRSMRCSRVMVLAPSDDGKGTFRRVGMGEIKGLTWFEDCEPIEITIV